MEFVTFVLDISQCQTVAVELWQRDNSVVVQQVPILVRERRVNHPPLMIEQVNYYTQQ